MNLKVLCYNWCMCRSNNTKTIPKLKGALRIMKLTAIFLLAASLQLSARVHSQDVITLAMKEATLQKVFKEINKQTGLQFFYKDKLLNKAGKVDINVSNMPVQEALQLCFKNLPIVYELVNNVIIVKEKPAKAATTELPTPPLPVTITGTVTNERGEPIAGASVQVKGTQIGTTTNELGIFVMKDADKDAVLIITGTNIEKTEVKVNGSTTLNIVAKEKIGVVDEVQIIGYGTTTKRLNTSTVSSVKGGEITDRPVTSVMSALQGKLSGVAITNSGSGLGVAPDILIRGVNSLTSGTNPLIIVDGVVVNEKTNSLMSTATTAATTAISVFTYWSGSVSTLNFINPSDIETVTVLKDADATGIYGSRGTNGVILITTKKGALGKTKLSVNISKGWKSSTGLSPRMNTQQFLQMRKDAFATGNMTSPSSVINPITPTIANAPDLLVWDQNAYTDFTKLEAKNPAPDYKTDINISSGTKALNYAAALSYYRMYDVYLFKPYQERMTSRMQINHTSVNNRFNLSIGSIFGIEKQKFSYLNAYSISGLLTSINPPNFPLYKSDGSLNLGPSYSSNSFFGYNPYVNETISTTSKTRNLLMNADISYKIINGLVAKLQASYSLQENIAHQIIPSTAINSQDNLFNAVPAGSHTNISFTSVNIEPQLSYSRSISKATISALVGSTFLDKKTDRTAIKVSNPGADGLLSSYAAGQPTTGTSENSEEKFASVFGRLNANWDKKYILNLSFRRDGSSRFGPNNRFANFASVGAGWVFTSESFIKDKLSFLNYGKLRASYGTTGNNNIADYQYLGLLTTPPTYLSGAYPGYLYAGPLAPANYPNPNIKWETTIKNDIGIELWFLKSRIQFSSTWYRSISTDLLITLPIAAQSGFSSYIGNFPGKVQNTGWEFELTTKNFTSPKGLQWITKFNLTANKNILKSFPNLAGSSYANTLKIGRAVVTDSRSLRLEMPYQFNGIDPATGLPLIGDTNKDGIVNSNDYLKNSSWIGTSKPTLWGGLTNTISYKGFSLDVFLQFSNGIFTKWNFSLSTPVGTALNPVADVAGNYWMKPGDVSKYPRLYTNTAGNATYINPITAYYPNSTATLYKGYYVRLKNLQLSYNIPAHLLQTLKMSNVIVYMSGENLAVYTPVKLYKDPETMTSSIPTTGLFRTITTGVKVEF